MSSLSTIAVDVNGFKPECTIYPARKEHKATVFFLHGLGGSGKDISTYVQDLIQDPNLKHVRFVFPSAPKAPVTGARNAIMQTWFDCYSFDIATRREDEAGLYCAATWLNELIAAEQADSGIPAEKIIIGGISQGGAVSILTATTTLYPIGGLFVLSSYIPLRKKIQEIIAPNCANVPIFWGHGNLDLQVDEKQWRDFAKTFAEQVGIPFVHSDKNSKLLNQHELMKAEALKGLKFRTYDGLGHWFNGEELQDLASWISVALKN